MSIYIFYGALSFVVGLGSALVSAERRGVSGQRLVIRIVRTMLPIQALNVGAYNGRQIISCTVLAEGIVKARLYVRSGSSRFRSMV